jgi:hypothetical protein
MPWVTFFIVMSAIIIEMMKKGIAMGMSMTGKENRAKARNTVTGCATELSLK